MDGQPRLAARRWGWVSTHLLRSATGGDGSSSQPGEGHARRSSVRYYGGYPSFRSRLSSSPRLMLSFADMSIRLRWRKASRDKDGVPSAITASPSTSSNGVDGKGLFQRLS
jgi:hypothetical protein